MRQWWERARDGSRGYFLWALCNCRTAIAVGLLLCGLAWILWPAGGAATVPDAATLFAAKDVQGSFQSWFDRYADVPITLGTFILALLIGIAGSRRSWQESLPLRLTVLYTYSSSVDGPLRTPLLIEDVPLTDPGNAREWAQALLRLAPIEGRAIKDGKETWDRINLPLDVFAIQAPITVRTTGDGSLSRRYIRRVVMHYSLRDVIRPQDGQTALPAVGVFSEEALTIVWKFGQAAIADGSLEQRWHKAGGRT